MRGLGRVVVALGMAVGIGCLGAIVTLMVVGIALQLDPRGMDVAATLIAPLWVAGLLPFTWAGTSRL